VFAVLSVLHHILFKLHPIQVLYIDVTCRVITLFDKCCQSLPVCLLNLHIQLTHQIVPLTAYCRGCQFTMISCSHFEHMPDYKVTYALDSIILGYGTLSLDN